MTSNQGVLREPKQRISFCKRYFSAVAAPLLRESDEYLECELPRDVDKELTDRPFYWLWVEKTNQSVTPTTLRLAFTKEAQEREDERLKLEHDKWLEKNPPTNSYEKMFARPPKTELISLGCFRFEKILSSAVERGRFTSVSPNRAAAGQELVPWLLVCSTIAYQSDSLQQQSVSLGICLENGQILFDFYDKIKRIPMGPTPVSEVTKRAVLLPADAIDLYQKVLIRYLTEQPHDWAFEAKMRLQDDLSQIDTYYQSLEREADDPSYPSLKLEHARKREDIIKKGTPGIKIKWTQIAFVGLPLRTSNLT